MRMPIGVATRRHERQIRFGHAHDDTPNQLDPFVFEHARRHDAIVFDTAQQSWLGVAREHREPALP